MHRLFIESVSTSTTKIGFVALRLTLVALFSLVVLNSVRADEELDPWEGYNRWMFDSNDVFDRVFVKPIAEGYVTLMPELARTGVNNFFNNFYDFNGVMNAMLQGSLTDAAGNSLRILVNTTLGVFGLFDIASEMGIPRYETDFGHTLSTWGVARGNYVVLPFLGPSTVRSSAGMIFDAFAAPTGQIFDDDVYWGLRSFNVLELRASLLDAEEIISGDRYLFFRDAYLQSLAALESGGEVKDDFSEFESVWDEDDF